MCILHVNQHPTYSTCVLYIHTRLMWIPLLQGQTVSCLAQNCYNFPLHYICTKEEETFTCVRNCVQCILTCFGKIFHFLNTRVGSYPSLPPKFRRIAFSSSGGVGSRLFLQHMLYSILIKLHNQNKLIRILQTQEIVITCKNPGDQKTPFLSVCFPYKHLGMLVQGIQNMHQAL